MYAHMPIIRDILYGAASHGASLKELCTALNLSAEALNDSGRSVAFETAYRSWELAVKHTGDPLLGLHLGEATTPSILGLIGHLMQSSPDLLTAYEQVCRHAELATNMFHYSITTERDQTLLMYRPAKIWNDVSPNSARQAVDQAMAGTLHVFYLLSGRNVTPAHATVTFSKPKSVREYERIFGSISFGKKNNALIFKTTDLKLPVIGYDQSLFAMFDTIIQDKIKALRREQSLADIVRKILAEDFKGRIVPAELVASRLNMSVRTFQRKLTAEGVTYRDIAMHLRKEFAQQLLRQPGIRLQEVARMLGYSEASALRKVLKD